ncbi:MAG TPA: AraC family transcriptional regulator [Ktedonobacterales bacterium]
MDVLSDTLRVLRLSGAVFFTARFASPWGIFSPPAGALAQFLSLSTDCVTPFHVVVEGRCAINLENHQTIELDAGDVIILPHGAAHVMGNDQQTDPMPLGALLPPLTNGAIPEIEIEGPGQVTRFICGFLQCDRQFNPLLRALPDALVISNRDQAARAAPGHGISSGRKRTTVIRSGEWLGATLRQTVEESDHGDPGSVVMLGRLAEILFVEALRRYMRELPPAQPGWLSGVKDPVVGQALALLHANPERDWTVDDLARAAAVSRSTLADRFTLLIGEPPMRYLTRWRMQLAQHLLRQTELTVATVAARVGYASEVAFGHAFKRYVGQPPVLWRLSDS